MRLLNIDREIRGDEFYKIPSNFTVTVRLLPLRKQDAAARKLMFAQEYCRPSIYLTRYLRSLYGVLKLA